MKTFKDLNFEAHPISLAGIERYENAKQAVKYFENGYGVSVLFGNCFYSNGVDTYELAVLHGDEITYSTEIASDVIGNLTEEGVTEIMQKVQALKVE